MVSIKEVGGGITLFGKTGMPLISFFKEDPCRVHISYNNVNIDKEDLAIHAVGKYGEVHDCYVDCVSDAEQALCFSRFIELATNGFASELRELVAMDWEDLERASFNSCAGRYYHATSSPQEIINALSKIRGKSLADCGTEACSIVCVDGNVSQFDFCMAVDPWEHASSVIQLLYDETNEIQIDVWTFPIMNSDSI